MLLLPSCCSLPCHAPLLPSVTSPLQVTPQALLAKVCSADCLEAVEEVRVYPLEGFTPLVSDKLLSIDDCRNR